jgi:hypothetical protein
LSSLEKFSKKKVSVRPSVCMEELGLQRTDFHNIFF